MREETLRLRDQVSQVYNGNYTVTSYDIVDDTAITNPFVVYPQVLEYILIDLTNI